MSFCEKRGTWTLLFSVNKCQGFLQTEMPRETSLLQAQNSSQMPRCHAPSTSHKNNLILLMKEAKTTCGLNPALANAHPTQTQFDINYRLCGNSPEGIEVLGLVPVSLGA